MAYPIKYPTRGERNRNPGNLEYHAQIPWQGQLGIEDGKPGRFAKFDTPENGIRAIAKILLHYHREGYDTIRKIIEHWAPAAENDSTAYVDAVAYEMQCDPDAPLDPTVATTMEGLVTSIIHYENGRVAYDPSVIATGVMRALPESA